MTKYLLLSAAALAALFWMRYGTFDPCEAAQFRVSSQYAREMIDTIRGAHCIRALWLAEFDPGAFSR